MSYLLFLDESGIDRSYSPYEVLAGLAIRDQNLWELIRDFQRLEEEFFGQRVSPGKLELKAKKLLKRKTYRHAAQLTPISPVERKILASACLDKGARTRNNKTAEPVTREELTALAQTKIVFAESVLETCSHHDVKAFASIVPQNAPRTTRDFLRKDYSYLFERFYYFLEGRSREELGLVIFDELERSQCHVLNEQMRLYFQETATGRLRARRIIPEPFFVHSELSTAVQLADLVAYVICWGIRFGEMDEPPREELAPLARRVLNLRHSTLQNNFRVWSFKLIPDLRPLEERLDR